MAVIEHASSSRRVTLAERCLVGRAPHCHLSLNDALTSAEHAVLHFRHGAWTVRDLGSSNGTKVNGEVLAAGERRELALDDELVFGDVGARWRLLDVSAPQARARRLGKEGEETVRLEDSGLLALPEADAPQACLFCDDEGRWWLEHDGPARLAADQQILQLPDGDWLLELPPPSPSSALPTTRQLRDQPTLLEEATLSFKVSQDEEHVELQLLDVDRVFDLGARVHHYLLLTLARARERDALSHQPEAERGWRYADELAQDIGVDLTQLNLQVYRARQQLAKAGVLNHGKVVERRAGSRQLRLGPSLVRID